MNIDVIQSQRKRKNKRKAEVEAPDGKAADTSKVKSKAGTTPVSPSAMLGTGNGVLNLPASSIPPLSLS